MSRKTWKLLANEDGVTIVEYALLLGLLSIVAIGLLSDIGVKLVGMFRTVLDKI